MKPRRRAEPWSRRELPTGTVRGSFQITDAAVGALERLLPTYRGADGAQIGVAAYPAGVWPNGSIFHSNGLICATWSRDAYGDRGGPHANWGAATQWQTVAPESVQAATIADMLARIYYELQLSPHRMQPLPEITEQAA
jgi:hypothetical protein